MNLLLDTHAFLWFVGGDTALSRAARDAIEDLDNSCFLSMASAWELSIKSSLGKIEFTEPFESFLPEQLKLNGFDLFNINWRHVAQVHSLPFHHRDPFDRLILAVTGRRDADRQYRQRLRPIRGNEDMVETHAA